VHNRENAGLLEIARFDLLVVFKKTAHMGRRIEKRGEKAGADDGIKIALEQHLVGLSIRRDMSHFVAGWQFHLHARMWGPGVPFDVVQLDTVFMLQGSPHPDGRRLLKLRQADSLAHKILRFADTAFRIYKDIRVAKRSRWKDRNGRQRFSDRPRNQI
jgi:hypothetical protein